MSRDPQPKFTKFGEHVSIGQTPNRAKFRRSATKVREISALENSCSLGSVPKSTEIGDNLLRTNAKIS